MSEKLKGFPNCYIVTLEESTERREYMKSEMDRLGLNYKFIEHKRIDNNPDLKVVGTDELLNSLTIGCCTSHLNTIKWWYENTDEEEAVFMEDDVDFSTVDLWSFNWEDYVKKFGPLWDVLQLAIVHEGWPVMYPRHRNGWDHGLQVYLVKRHYAKRIIEFYFNPDDHNMIRFHKMPYVQKSDQNYRYNITTENIVYGLGTVYVHPIFNHSLKFTQKSTIHEGGSVQPFVAEESHQYVKQWWENKASKGTLDELFSYRWCCPPPQQYSNVLHIDH